MSRDTLCHFAKEMRHDGCERESCVVPAGPVGSTVASDLRDSKWCVLRMNCNGRALLAIVSNQQQRAPALSSFFIDGHHTHNCHTVERRTCEMQPFRHG